MTEWEQIKRAHAARDRYNQLLKQFTYKRGWKFKVDSLDDQLTLYMRMDCEDTYNPGHQLSLTSSHDLPSKMALEWEESEENDAEFYIWVREQIHWRECHEADEWIRINDKMVWNPHLPHVKITNGRGIIDETVTYGSYADALAARIRDMS